MDVKVRVRDGCRGGREQFQWNQVTSQDFKDREQYLGASTKVGMMGKFGQYYLHDWYARKRDTPDSIENEQASIKAYEEELMQEALGLKPKKLLLQKKQLSEEELKVALAKEKPEGRRGRQAMGPQAKLATNEHGEQVVQDDATGSAYLETTIKGIGFASHRNAKLEEYKVQALGSTTKLEGCIKVEDGDDDGDVLRFGFKTEVKTEVKTEPGVKSEPAAKVEAEAKAEAAEAKEETQDAVKREADAKRTRSDEVKNEAADRTGKRRRDDDTGSASDEGDAAKAAKDEKRRRKAEKKHKKLTKKLKKAAKKAKKAAKTAKKAKKRAKSGSSASSSSSS